MDFANRALVNLPEETIPPCNVIVKIEPYWCEDEVSAECAPVKQEPEGGVSAAAATEGLYAGHEVKHELVVGPELVHQPNLTFNMQSCPTIKEEDQSCMQPASGATSAAVSVSFRSLVQQHRLRRCCVRLQRLPVALHTCRTCNLMFDSELSVSDHSLKHATNQTKTASARKTIYPCDICEEQFTCKKIFQKHIRTHKIKELYGCTECDRQFKSKSKLICHIRVHTGEKPYMCTVCDKQFTQRSNLFAHMRVHTGEKPFSCDMCNRRFTNTSHLTRHKRTHTGEKPYGCAKCDKRFTQLYILTKHMKTHQRVVVQLSSINLFRSDSTKPLQ